MAKGSSESARNRAISCGIFLLCSSLLLVGLHSPSLAQLDWLLLDQSLKQRAATRHAAESIVIIDIDERSLEAIAPLAGKWPWPRSLHAELLEYLNTLQPQAIVFDILFTEPDVFRPDADGYFAEVVAQSPTLFLPFASQASVTPDVAPLIATYPEQVALQAEPGARPDARLKLLLPLFLPAQAQRLGNISYPNQQDSVRRYPVYQHEAGWRIQSLPAVVAEHLGKPPSSQALLLDWYGPRGMAFQRFSYAEALSQARGEASTIPEQYLRDKILLIGSTALGLHDFHNTPVHHHLPGVYVLATALNNLLDGQALTVLPHWLLALVGLSVLAITTVCFHTQRASLGLIFTMASTLCLVGMSWWGMRQGLVIHVVAILLPLLLACLVGLLVTYHRNQLDLQQTRHIFSRFMDPAVVEQLVDDPEHKALTNTRSVDITVLFSDIRNFTSISEQRTPGEVVNMLNQYFDAQLKVLFAHQATLDKFIGDAVMAFWGAPVPQENHAILAVDAALAMVDALETFKRDYGYADFDIGIGIHTGRAVVGLIGSHARYDYTAIGDSVNLASRIEGLTKNCAHILVSETTMELCGEHFGFSPKGEFKVKGREQPVKVYEPYRKSASAS